MDDAEEEKLSHRLTVSDQKKEKNQSDTKVSRSSLDEEIQQFIRQERVSRLRMGIFATLGVLFFAGVGLLLFSTADQVLKLPIDVEGGEAEVLAATNDPQCHQLIENIDKIGLEYKSYLPQVNGLLTMEDQSQLQKIVDRLAEFRHQLDEEKSFYPKANLRFPQSAGELRKWFRYTDNEISILQDLALWKKNQLTELLKKKQLQQNKGNGNDSAETVIILKQPPRVSQGAGRIEASKKTPQELFDGALVASQEAFETFRVWHSGSISPCGAAEPDEEPWKAPVKPLADDDGKHLPQSTPPRKRSI